MKVLSLFDGISCGRKALENIGIEVEKYYTSEIDRYASAITRYNYPDVVELGDINNIDIDYIKTLGLDLVMGGSPCQDLSLAWKGAGLAGERSGLFYKFVEILKAIEPKYFLLENVRMKQEYEDIITDLMGVDPLYIDSKDYSAQTRKRLYWTNIERSFELGYEAPKSRQVISDIMECEVEEKYYLSKKMEDCINKYPSDISKDITKKSNCIISTYNNLNKSSTVLRVGQIGNGGQGERIYSTQGKSITLSSDGGNKTGLYEASERIRRLTPTECERMQGLPDNYTKYGIIDDKQVEISDTQRYKAIGNGWQVDTVIEIFKGIAKK